MRALPILLVLLSGCTLYTGGDGDDALPACDTTQRAYLIDQLELPASSTEAQDLGWDLDGDRAIDNQGGSLIAAVASALDVDLQGAVDEALANGLVQIGFTVDECAAPSYGLVSLIRRADGNNVTTVPAVARDGLPGAALHGTTRFPVGQLIHPVVDRWIEAAELVVAVDDLDDDYMDGHLVAALDHDEAFDVVARGFQAKIVDREAELGPCTPEQCDSVLRTLYDVFDTNSDGIVTLAEIEQSSLFIALLAPDLDLDHDGVLEHLSIGVGFRALRVDEG